MGYQQDLAPARPHSLGRDAPVPTQRMAAGLLGDRRVWRGCCNGGVGALDAFIPGLLGKLAC